MQLVLQLSLLLITANATTAPTHECIFDTLRELNSSVRFSQWSHMVLQLKFSSGPNIIFLIVHNDKSDACTNVDRTHQPAG